MYVSETSLRVRYAETDRMGYAYYGNYLQYYEVGRVEALRQLGMSYRTMEDQGVMLPVYTCNVKYIKPAFYDDLLIIRTTVPEIPKARILFQYDIFNEAGELINKGETTLVFISTATNKPCGAPKAFLEKISGYFPAS
jgi:acyl-CoA thioester hydrolase